MNCLNEQRLRRPDRLFYNVKVVLRPVINVDNGTSFIKRLRSILFTVLTRPIIAQRVKRQEKNHYKFILNN